MAQFTFKDNSNEVLRRMRGAMEDSAQEVKDRLIEAVQEKILYGYKDRHGKDGHTEIVDTGRLFDSIDAQVRKVSQNLIETTVGATGDTPYAVYVHQGTRKLKGRPFITDAINDSRREIRAIMENNLKNG